MKYEFCKRGTHNYVPIHGYMVCKKCGFFPGMDNNPYIKTSG